MLSVKTAIADAVKKLKDTSLSPALDGEVLLGFALGKDRAWLYRHSDSAMTAEEFERFSNLITQRKTGVPVAYLTGTKEFYGREFCVTPDVLIPRPATEELITEALGYARTHKPACIVDVGTGSGCIAVTLACEIPVIPIFATDLSPKALAVAQKNAVQHGVQDRITFVQSNLIEALPPSRSLLVVANLPYLPSHTITGDLAHEPRLALDGGKDGQTLYRRLDAGLQTFAEQNNVTITLISERLAYSKNTSVPSFTISIQTFPGANAISSSVSL